MVEGTFNENKEFRLIILGIIFFNFLGLYIAKKVVLLHKRHPVAKLSIVSTLSFIFGSTLHHLGYESQAPIALAMALGVQNSVTIDPSGNLGIATCQTDSSLFWLASGLASVTLPKSKRKKNAMTISWRHHLAVPIGTLTGSFLAELSHKSYANSKRDKQPGIQYWTEVIPVLTLQILAFLYYSYSLQAAMDDKIKKALAKHRANLRNGAKAQNQSPSDGATIEVKVDIEENESQKKFSPTPSHVDSFGKYESDGLIIERRTFAEHVNRLVEISRSKVEVAQNLEKCLLVGSRKLAKLHESEEGDVNTEQLVASMQTDRETRDSKANTEVTRIVDFTGVGKGVTKLLPNAMEEMDVSTLEAEIRLAVDKYRDLSQQEIQEKEKINLLLLASSMGSSTMHNDSMPSRLVYQTEEEKRKNNDSSLSEPTGDAITTTTNTTNATTTTLSTSGGSISNAEEMDEDLNEIKWSADGSNLVVHTKNPSLRARVRHSLSVRRPDETKDILSQTHRPGLYGGRFSNHSIHDNARSESVPAITIHTGGVKYKVEGRKELSLRSGGMKHKDEGPKKE